MMKYSSVFEPRTIDFNLYKRIYSQVMTRCFNTSLYGTAMVPMSDMYNHYHYWAEIVFVVKRLQLSKVQDSDYFTKSEFMNDYSQFFWPDLQQLAAETTSGERSVQEWNVRGRFIRENYEANLQYQSLNSFKKMIEDGVQLWDVPRLIEKWEEKHENKEDGTVCEEEDDEEEEEMEERITNMMGKLMTLELDIEELAKGFEYFADKEKKEVRMVRERVRE